MYDLETHITTIVPGKSPCLNCLYPQRPAAWRREFPVFGAVSGMVACLGAVEVIKLIAGFGETLAGRLLMGDLRTMTFHTMRISRRPDCDVCGDL
jgi:bacteriocin biosynthesis cyclodehydratase domain-containing protein